MSSTRSQLDRLRDYERRHVQSFTAEYAAWQDAEDIAPAPRRARRVTDMANTMGPQEDVIESRQRRRHHVTTTAEPNNGGMAENLFLLVLLAASIYGLYRLCIYLLMQG